MQYYRDSFATGELGRIYNKLPLAELAQEIRSRMPRKGVQGRSRMFPLEGEIALMLLILHLAAIHVVEIVARGRPSSPHFALGRDTRCGTSTTPRSTSKSPTPSSRTNPNCAAANKPPSKKSRRKWTTSSPPPTNPPAPPTAPPPLSGEDRGGAAVQLVVAVEGAHGGVAGLFG